MTEEINQSSKQSLQKYFDTEINGETYEQLKAWLTERVVNLLLNNMEALLTILYRADVSERKVKEAFSQSDSKLIAPKIAELLINRETEKAKSREKYRKP